jgi:predicted heme/steroid binding protein
MNKNIQWWMVKIDRAAAWALLATIIAFFISGYGMTKGIIDRTLANNLHSNILPLIGLVAFTVHTGLAVRMSLMRGRLWNGVSKILLILIYAVFLIGLIYIGFFYQKQTANIAPQTQTQAQTQNKTETQTQTSGKTFTLSELAQYNGKNGQPAYVAVDGIVYDLSAIFINGQHQGYAAGQDLTAAFYSQHAINQLTKYPVMGKLKQL